MRKGMHKFLLTTSLHGWGHFEREPGVIRKTIWIFYLFGVMAVSVFTVYENAAQVRSALIPRR